MHDRRCVRVVEIERMRERRIYQHRACGRIAFCVRKNAGFAVGEAQRVYRGKKRRRAFGIPMRPHRIADTIKYQQPRAEVRLALAAHPAAVAAASLERSCREQSQAA